MTIPKIIHQTVADKSKLHQVFLDNVSRLKDRNRNWDHRLYDDREVREFIVDSYGSEMVGRYDRLNPLYGAARADLFRYLLLYKFGGVYLDIKSTATKPLDDVLNADDAYLLSHWRNKLGQRFEGWGLYFPECGPDGEYQQWHIVASAGHPFLEAVIQKVTRNIDTYDLASAGVGKAGVVKTTGPLAYTLAIKSIQAKHAYRHVDIEDLGFQYSIVGAPGSELAHVSLFKNHYETIGPPVVMRELRDPFGGLVAQKYRRNEPCPCGSGRKYKHCHGYAV
jgi:mannosyltransferase OCH1-like enzyme